MTEPTTPANPTETSTAATAPETSPPETSPPAAPATPAAEPEPGEDREAAKYRRKLRDTEGERDALTERLAALQRAEVERLAATTLADGGDVWLAGTELADVLDDDGGIDADKVTALVQSIATDRPHWQRRDSAAAPTAIVTSRDKIEGEPAPASWTDVLQARNGTSG